MNGQGNRAVQSLECILTTACNLTCPYCHQGEHSSRVMGWETLKPWIDDLLASDVDKPALALTGGEPLMEWSLVQRAVEYARKKSSDWKGLAISLTINGLLLDGEKARFLVAHDVEVQISLDGIREAHEFRAPGTFDQLEGLLLRLRRNHPSWFRRCLSVGMTLTSANLPFLSRSIAFLVGHGIESIRIGPLLTHDEGWGSESETELKRQLKGVFDLCLEHRRRTGAVPLEVFRRPSKSPDPQPDRAVCRVNAPDTMAVGVDGRASRCPLLLEPGKGGTQAGEILREWKARSDWPGLRRNRYSGWGRCRDCEFVDQCLVCPVASANIPGNTDPRRVPDFSCAFNRTIAKYRRVFPPMPDCVERLKGSDPLPTAMTDLAAAFGVSDGVERN